ncbi:MAG: S8 family serine peptidase [Actinomycetota bacterium]
MNPAIVDRWTGVIIRGAAAVAVTTLTLVGPLAAAAGEAPVDGADIAVLEQGADGRVQVRVIEAGDVVGASADSTILAMEPVGTVHALVEPDTDPLRGDQWALDAIDVEQSWDVADGDGTVIAIVDTGVRATHEDLTGRLLPIVDLLDGRVDGDEHDHFHGSHVAGIAVATAENGRGTRGVAPGAQLLPIRALGLNGTGSTATVAEGILHAVEAGADVINLSLGANSPSTVINGAIQHAISQDVVVVAASGNSGERGNPTIWPAALEGVLTVGAIDTSGQRASFSSYGSYVDVVAPGYNVLSTQEKSDGSYGGASGTSMAAPHVAAVVAMVRQADPSLSEAEVRDVITSTADDIAVPGRDDETGHGLLDPHAAVLSARGAGASPDTPTSAPYTLITDTGRVISAGAGVPFGDGLTDVRLAKPVVAAAASEAGYWMVAADGGIFAFGDARFHGSMGGIPLNQPINGMAATSTGGGYWMVASDGGIFAFGDARFYGSMGGTPLNQPINGMAATPSGEGYWLVASDGGIFAFGDARFHGSTGSIELVSPIVGMATTPSGEGYWLVAADGGVFTFGDARFHGSAASFDLDEPVEGIVASPSGAGYLIATLSGELFAFGDAVHPGETATTEPGERIVDIIPG